MKRYFVFSPDFGFKLFETFDEAQKVAQEAIDDYRDACASDGEWDPDVEHVYFGEVLAQSKEVPIIGDEGQEYCDFVLEALPPKEANPC